MDGFVLILSLFLVFLIAMLFLIFNLKGNWAVYLSAFTATLSAWFVGLVLDANIRFGDPSGFLSLRILLPVLAMGLCILNAILKNRF